MLAPPRRLAAPLAAALAVLASGCAHGRAAAPAETPGPRRIFVIPEHGALELEVPPGWEARLGEGEPPTPVTVELAPPDRAFVLLLTPFWSPEPEGAPADADAAQLLAELARRKALEGSEEAELSLHELVGESVHGFYFAATDRSLAGKPPGRGEYRHLIQGTVAVGRILLAFSLLDDVPGPQRERALEVVRGARHLGPGEPEAGGDAPGGLAGGFEPDPGAATVPLAVELPGRGWSVLVDLPGFELFRPRRGDDGRSVLVLGREPRSDLVASVILREEPGLDAAGCREAALARIARTASPSALARVDRDGIARVAYDLTELRGRRIVLHHVHAFAAREGVCVNLHLSKADPAPEDAARVEGIVRSLRFGEAL